MRSENPQRGVEVALVDMVESATNPRTVFTGLRELAQSLIENGQIENIVLRPNPRREPNGVPWEVVVGARRFRAAILARFTHLRADIRNLTDREALELSLVENDQRERVHPLDEAVGYLRLHEEHGASMEEIAAKMGRTVRHVAQRMRLTQLCEPGKVLFRANKILEAGAFMIARLEVVELQVQLSEELGRIFDNEEGEQPIDSWRIRLIIEQRYLTDLTAAPWTRKLPMVLADGTTIQSCTTCPKRTGNQGTLFEELASKDICTDVLCYAKKKHRHFELVQVRLKEGGRAVFDQKTSRSYFLGGSTALSTNAPYLDLDQPVSFGGNGKTLRALLGKKIPDEVVGAIDGAGGVHELVAKDQVADALEAAGHAEMAGYARRLLKPGSTVKDVASKEEQEASVHRLAVASSLEVMVGAAARRSVGLEFWAVLVGALLGMVCGEALKQICRRRGLAFGGGTATPKDVLARAMTSGNEQHARGLVLELAVAHGLYKGAPQPFEDAKELFGVDWKREQAKARKALKLEPVGGRPRAKKVRLDDLPDDDEDEPGAACCELVEMYRQGKVETAPQGGLGFSTCSACGALGEQIEEVIAEGYLMVPKLSTLIEHVTEGGEGVVGEHAEGRVLAVYAGLARRGRVWEDAKGNLHTHRRALRKKFEQRGAVRVRTA